MTVKALATGVAAVAAIGAAAASVTSAAAGGTSNHPAAFPQPVVLGAPLPSPASGRYPLDPPPPAPDLPTAEQLSNLCTQVTDPGVSYTTKTGLVENGISPGEGHEADHELRKAYRNGNFPEQFNVTNIQPAGPNAATADVAISGPKLAGPVTKNLAFVDEGGNWIMQHDSATALVQAATATS